MGSSPLTRGKPQIKRSGLSRTRAHPRSRGENVGDFFDLTAEDGSSPLTRGKPIEFNTSPGSGGAHPRSRGENSHQARRSLRKCGSSPLTRGKPHVVVEVAGFVGLIPAHAGKTQSRTRPSGGPGAHPRSRGENTDEQSARAGDAGSSPLTRGKHCDCPFRIRMRGLIPAHAGKTTRLRRPLLTGWAHPRSRGENSEAGLRG